MRTESRVGKGWVWSGVAEISVALYVCMHVCTCVHVYICTYIVCTYVCMYVCMYITVCSPGKLLLCLPATILHAMLGISFY